MFSFYVFTLLMFRKPNKTTINKNKTNVHLYMVRLICNNVIEIYYLGLSHVAIYSRKVVIGGLVLLPLHYMPVADLEWGVRGVRPPKIRIAYVIQR